MENKKSFFIRLEPILAPSDIVKIRGAYYLAKYGHRAQVRKELDLNGNKLRYFEHVRRTAIILMDEVNCFDPDLICSALLHDSIEDTEDLDSLIIESFFGKKVAQIVRILTNKPKEGYYDRLELNHDALLIKLCDRLDNLRSLPKDNVEFCLKQKNKTIPLLLKSERVLDRKYSDLIKLIYSEMEIPYNGANK